MNKKVGSVKVTKFLSSESIRNTCIRMEWYTLGTNEEYSELLSFVDSVRCSFTDDDLLTIACDIYDKSFMLNDYYECYEEAIDNILFTIMKFCIDYFPSCEIEKNRKGVA